MKYSLLLILFSFTFVACSAPKARKPVNRSSKTIMKQSVALNKKIYTQENAYFKKIIAKDSLQTYQESNRGFWYTYQKTDSTKQHQLVKGDLLVYTYQIKDIYGNTIYAEEEVGIKKYRIDEEVIIQGLQEGLKLMRENEKMTFLFPSHKAYGYAGNQDRISPNQPLIFDVTLLEINPKLK